eukprot:scaffold34877_cov39-Cyclotella_meneghiniana.AAC.4
MDTICCHLDTKSFFVSRKIGRVNLWDPRDPAKRRSDTVLVSIPCGEWNTDLTSVLTPAAGMEAHENQYNEHSVSADEIELLCIALEERPAGFSTPYDYLRKVMKSSNQMASDALAHLVVTRKQSNETLPLVVGQPTTPKLRMLFFSILKKLYELEESTLANVVNDRSKSVAKISADPKTDNVNPNKIVDSVAKDSACLKTDSQADESAYFSLQPTLIALTESLQKEENENVPTVSTLSEHSQKVVEAVEILQSENKELKREVKQHAAQNTMLQNKLEKLETDVENNTYQKTKLQTRLQELEEVVNQLRNDMTADKEVRIKVDLSNVVLQLELLKSHGIDENDGLEDSVLNLLDEISLSGLSTSKWYSKVDSQFHGIEVALWRSNLALLQRNKDAGRSKRILICSRILSNDNYQEEIDLVSKSNFIYKVVTFMYKKTLEKSSQLYFVYSSKSNEDFETNIFPHVWNNDFSRIEDVKAEIKEFVSLLHNDVSEDSDADYRHDILNNMVGEVFAVASYRGSCNQRREKLLIRYF